jgi:Mn2+/Fe2+ NRAMP family transporter
LGPGWRTRHQNRLTVIVIGSIVAVTMQQPIKVMLMLNFVRMTMFMSVPMPVTVFVPVLGDDLGMILSRLQNLRRMRDARHHRPKDQ